MKIGSSQFLKIYKRYREKYLKFVYTDEGFGYMKKTDKELIEELEQRLKEAERALAFYADEENYEPQDYKGMRNLPPISGDYVPLSDNGKKAREYFEKYEGEE